MRFLADENVEAPVIEAMRAAGHDVACIGEIAPGVEDQQVLRLANAQSRLRPPPEFRAPASLPKHIARYPQRDAHDVEDAPHDELLLDDAEGGRDGG